MTASVFYGDTMKDKDYTDDEMRRLLYSQAIKINQNKASHTYSRTFEGIAAKLEKAYSGKAEDEVPDEEKNVYAQYFVFSDCEQCGGTRLNERALGATIAGGYSIADLCRMELGDLLAVLRNLHDDLAVPVLRKAVFLLEQLIHIGVGYLSLDRAVSTLSGGESQRVKMARQLDCNLVDLLYVLDEPSIGLHPRDTERLIELLFTLKDKGNSVIVVEHDPEIIKKAEWIIDIGPEAGKNGGRVVYSGEPEGIKNTESITGRHLYGQKQGSYERKKASGFIEICNASVHNLKNVSVRIPQKVLTCVTGVAGSGKSSLIHECLAKSHPGAVLIDQSPAGKSSRANLVTYIEVFDQIRKIFAESSGAAASLFSFNSKGACHKCKGQGVLRFELNFMDAVKTVCDECEGKRYHADVLAYRYRNCSIADVLDMTVTQALAFFTQPKIVTKLNVLKEVGLSYLRLGQSLSTFSGGEAQRLKIALELGKKSNLYIMDEPTSGLHMSDIANLYRIIRALVDGGNTVVIIEHNLDIIRHADWVIDMGPEGGKFGGEIVFEGVPEDLVKHPASHTGRFLKELL